MAENVKVLDANGNETTAQVPEKVTKSAVDQTLAALTPALREFGVSLGESMGDKIEKSLEAVAKSMEKNEPLNQDVVLPKLASKGASVMYDEVVTPEQRKALAQDYVTTLLKGGRQNGPGLEYAKELAKGNPRLTKALAASDYGSAGILIPDEIIGELKTLRDDAVVIRQVAGRQLTLRHGATSIPKELVNATAFYADESDDLTPTSFERGEERIEPKKLTVLIAATNELMKDGINVGQIIQDQMFRAWSLKENATLIRGAGSPKQPIGLKSQIHSDHVFARSQNGSTSTVQEIRADLVDAIMKPQIANLDGDGAWMMPAAIKSGLMKILTSDFTMAPFFAEIMSGRLMGGSVFVTNSIPDNLGAGDEGELYYVLRNHLMIVDSQDLTFETSRDASYKDSSGTLVSAFSRDEYVARLIGRSAIHLMYDKAASLVTTVDWNNL